MKSIKKYLVSTVAILFLTCMFLGIRAEAASAPAQVTGVKQTVAGKNNFKVEWNHIDNTHVYYEVLFATSKTGTYQVVRTGISSNGYWDYQKQSGTSYWVKVRAYVVENRVNKYGALSAPAEAVTAPVAVTNLKQTAASKTSITLSWDAVPGASGYAIEYVPGDGSAAIQTVSATAATKEITGLKANKEYNISVRAYRKGETHTAYSLKDYAYNVPTLTSKVSGLECVRYWDHGSVGFTFNRKASADGYQIQIYEKNGKTKVKKVTINYNGSNISVMHSKLKKNKVYAAKIRAYIKINGANKYGAWSKIMYFSKQPELKCRGTSSGIKVSWKKLKGATSYTLYVSTRAKSGYKKVGTTKKDNLTIKKYGKSALKSRKAYYVYIIANTKVKGKTYKSPANYYWGPSYKR